MTLRNNKFIEFTLLFLRVKSLIYSNSSSLFVTTWYESSSTITISHILECLLRHKSGLVVKGKEKTDNNLSIQTPGTFITQSNGERQSTFRLPSRTSHYTTITNEDLGKSLGLYI